MHAPPGNDGEAAAGEDPGARVRAGELLWQTHEGGRKAGGVYYTPVDVVRHLVDRSVLPAFDRHLEKVAALARTDTTGAANLLLSFAVVDPACGSAHFLAQVAETLAERTVRFLAERHLPVYRGGTGEAALRSDVSRFAGRCRAAAPAAREALRLRCGREPDGRRGGEALAVAGDLRSGPVAGAPGTERGCRQLVDRRGGRRPPAGRALCRCSPSGSARNSRRREVGWPVSPGFGTARPRK